MACGSRAIKHRGNVSESTHANRVAAMGGVGQL